MNIKTVAKRARVSTATVSRTINGSARVSPETAERVRRAIEATNFYVDTNARSLGSGRSGLYGLIISDITNPFFPEMVKSFDDFAVKMGKEILIANTNYDAERMKLCVTRMIQRKVDGVAIMTSEMDDGLIKIFSRRNVPLVFFDRDALGDGMSCVRLDYTAGIDLAMGHLLKLNHKRIAFISGPLDLSSARDRLSAFRASSVRANLVLGTDYIQQGDHRVEQGHEAMVRLLALDPRPTAVITSNDLTAIGAVGAIHEAGLRVPQDISIIGFDDIQLSAYTSPPLTTVHVAHGEIAKASLEALRQMANPGKSGLSMGRAHVIAPTLVKRASTARAPR